MPVPLLQPLHRLRRVGIRVRRIWAAAEVVVVARTIYSEMCGVKGMDRGDADWVRRVSIAWGRENYVEV